MAGLRAGHRRVRRSRQCADPTHNRSVTPDLQATLNNLPDRPGVYLMKDARGEVVYVGKAQSLRSRVRSYWQKQAPTPRRATGSATVIDRVVDVEYTITDSVSEALLLEANLIKRFRPRFNVRLKDDKSYPYIKITLGRRLPAGRADPQAADDGSRYFGPYASASSVDESMNLVRRLFPFRTCTIDIKDGERALPGRACCTTSSAARAPASRPSRRPPTAREIAQIELFLEGRQEALVRRRCDRRCRSRRRRSEYERAAAVRDKIRAIERTMESQKMAAFTRTELDLVGLARQDNQAAIQLFVDPQRQDDRPRRVPARRVREAPRRGGPRELPRAVLRARDVVPPRSSCRRAPDAGRSRGVPGRAARRAGPPVACRSAARSGS